MDEENKQGARPAAPRMPRIAEPEGDGVGPRIDMLLQAAGAREVGIWHLPSNREKPWLVQIQTDGDYFFEQDPAADGLGATLEAAIDDCLRRLEMTVLLGRDPEAPLS